MGGYGSVVPDTGLTHSEFASSESLDDIATYASGVGPSKDTILRVGDDRFIEEATHLVTRIQARGLQVHPYTFRCAGSRARLSTTGSGPAPSVRMDSRRQLSLWGAASTPSRSASCLSSLGAGVSAVISSCPCRRRAHSVRQKGPLHAQQRGRVPCLRLRC